jgi:hypothetical protein
MSTFTFDLSSLQASGTSFERGLRANTPDDKLTYSGNDPIVWDGVNNERLRRGLSPLPNPRPVDDGRTVNTGRGGTQSTTPARDATPEERAEGERLARKFGLISNPDQTSSTFEVSGPPNMTREQAFAIFQKQASAGGLTGFQSGDILSAQTQAADGLEAARAELTQGFAGFPGTDQGAQNQLVSIAQSAKQSLAAGNTGNLQSRITNGGTLLQQTSAKIGGLFGVPVTNGIDVANFAKTATAVMPMSGLSTTDVRATMASVGAATGQNFDQITNAVGVGKFGFNAPQLETAGLLKPGTASTFLNQGSNDLTSVLKSPAVWTGAGGITGLDSFLSNPAAQNLTQQNLMSSGLATASSLGVPLNGLNAKELGGISSVFAKDSAAGADWIKGQLSPDKQADFDTKFKEAQFAVGTAEQKLNDAVLQQAPPGEATNTVDRTTVDAAATRVVGNNKVPNTNYGNEKADQTLIDENKALRKEIGALITRIIDVNAQNVTAATAEAAIAQMTAIRNSLETVREKAISLRTRTLNANPYSESLYQKLNEELADIVAAINNINDYIRIYRQLK